MTEVRDTPRWRELRNEIKRRIDYRSFFLRYLPQDARPTSGARLQARCPIPSHAHSGTGNPSLSIDLQRGLFHCFSRNEGGDALSFYVLMHGVSFGAAVREMAHALGLGKASRQGELPLALRTAPDPVESGPQTFAPLDGEPMCAVCDAFLEVCRREEQFEGLNYLERRGIDRKTAQQAGVAYFPRRAYHRVMRRMRDRFALAELQQSGLFNAREHLTFYRHRLLFPFYVEEHAVYLQARTTATGVEPRWHNIRGVVPSLYNIDMLARLASGAILYLVEGFTDTLTLSAHAFPAVGLVGVGGLKEEWLAPLGRFRVVAAFDPDVAGRRAATRYEEMFAARHLRLASLNLPTDVNDFFRQSPSAALEFTLLTEIALEKAAAGG